MSKKAIQVTMYVLIGFVIYACSPSISSSFSAPRSKRVNTRQVLVISEDDHRDINLSKLGELNFTSSEFNSKCEYENAIAKFKKLAARNGGNIVKITRIKNVNSFFENCKSLEADVYYTEDLEAFKASYGRSEEQAENQNKADIEASKKEDPAALYFYRLPNLMGDAMEFDIYLDGKLLCRSKDNWGEKVIVHKSGKCKLWTKTENSFSLPISIESGKEYYISCSVSFGLRNSKPIMKIMNSAVGRIEYNNVVGQILTMLPR